MKFVPTLGKVSGAIGVLSSALLLFATSAQAATLSNAFIVKVGLQPASNGVGGTGGGGTGTGGGTGGSGGGTGSGGGSGTGSGGTGGGTGTGNTGSNTGSNNFGFCRNTSQAGAFGASVTVACATGAWADLQPGRYTVGSSMPMHGGAFRFVTQATWNGEWIDSMDNPPGTGTITSWRLVRLSDRNVLELTVGW